MRNVLKHRTNLGLSALLLEQMTVQVCVLLCSRMVFVSATDVFFLFLVYGRGWNRVIPIEESGVDVVGFVGVGGWWSLRPQTQRIFP